MTKSSEYAAILEDHSKYIRFIADCLKLKDWRIDLEIDETVEDAHAVNICTNGRKVIVIQFSPVFFNEDSKGRLHTVCHEMLHATFQGICSVAESVEPTMGSPAYEVFISNFNTQVEIAVDSIADGVSRLLPTREEWEELGRPSEFSFTP